RPHPRHPPAAPRTPPAHRHPQLIHPPFVVRVLALVVGIDVPPLLVEVDLAPLLAHVHLELPRRPPPLGPVVRIAQPEVLLAEPKCQPPPRRVAHIEPSAQRA